MKAVNNLKKIGMIAAIFASILIPANLAYSANCFAELTEAEQRWNKLRAQKVLTSGFTTKVTHHLIMAAELRHQGMNEGCLRQLEKAKKEMDARGAKH